MAEPAQLDHAVINVRFEMDGAVEAFGRLGFLLTGRGHHSLGSINHLMIFGNDYLELLGLPPGGPAARPEIAAAPPGINALVLKTEDADATHAHLAALGLAGDPPKAFSRPLQLPQGEFPVKFRTVAVRPGVVPGGRVYFCEHLTPELVWRPEWQTHPNGAAAIAEFVIVSADFQKEAKDFAQMLNSSVAELPGGGGSSTGASVPLTGAQLTLLPPTAYAQRYGPLASPPAGRHSFFGAIVIRSRDLGALRRVTGELPPNVRVDDQPGRVVLREPTFDCVLEFTG